MKQQQQQKAKPEQIASIRCGWPDFVTRNTKRKPAITFSRLKGKNEQDFRPESRIAKSDKPFGGSRFQAKIEKAREEVSSNKAARNRLYKFMRST